MYEQVASRRHRAHWLRWVGLALLVALGAWGAWWMTHPRPLPTGQPAITATTPVTKPIYLGVLGPDLEGAPRRLELVEVTIPLSEDPGTAKVEAFVCRGGSLAQTSHPKAFCPDLEPATGAILKLGSGDQLVVSVESHTVGEVRVDPLVVTYRDGLQSGTQRTGPKITVDVQSR